MKHKAKITAIIIGMFLLTQFIGLAVLHVDPLHLTNETGEKVSNPALSWIQPPEAQNPEDALGLFTSLVISFIFAISIFFLLTKLKIEFVLRAWFFLVVGMALFITFYAFEKIAPFTISYKWALVIPILLAVPLAFFKIYKRNFLLHNLTEFFIYPGIAVLFVSILNLYTLIALLILISAYDMWAVWHSGIMQKMAKYQINKLNLFAGFFIPYASKKVKAKIRNMKKTLSKKELSKKKFKINVAILGGGDIIFPLISAGVVMRNFGFIPALFVTIGATFGLTYLMIFSEKKKWYPAMPFITVGIFLGMLVSWIIF